MSDLRVWGAPPEPEGVTLVTDRYGCPAERRGDGWWFTELTMQPKGMPWSELFWTAGPLKELANG